MAKWDSFADENHAEWDELRRQAGYSEETEESSEKKRHDKSRQYVAPEEKDDLYDLIDDPARSEDKKLFGLAKPFPKVTREGYRDYLHEILTEKAKEYDRKGIPPQDRPSEHHLYKEVDFSWLYRLKKRYHAELAEFLGTFAYLLIGFGSTVQFKLGEEAKSSYINVVTAWGLAQTLGIHISGGYSGAHLNPVVTFNLWFFRGFPFTRVVQFWIAQFFGALAASAWCFILYYPALRKLDPNGWSLNTGASFFTVPEPDIPIASAWFNEVSGTALIHLAIFAIGDSQNIVPVRGLNALVSSSLQLAPRLATSQTLA